MLTTKITDIANAIRNKTGESGSMKLADMPDKITNIQTGEDVEDEVNVQTPLITEITESLVGKATGANATADKILQGYSAYVGQQLVEGTFDINTVVKLLITQPTKTVQYLGDALDLTGVNVTAIFRNGNIVDVTSETTFSPLNGSIIEASQVGDLTITATYEGLTVNTSVAVKTYEIVTWANGTDKEITRMVNAHYNGLINLQDYWAVGQERKVNLYPMSATEEVTESHIAQTVTMVLMNKGGIELTNGKECAFVVGQKNGLLEKGYMNAVATNSGSWDYCLRRRWCNDVYKNAIPSSLVGIFKEFKTITADYINGIEPTTSDDYFALPAERQIFGSNTYGSSTAEASLTQFEYYKTTINRVKSSGDNGSANSFWERSPRSNSSSHFCSVNSSALTNYGSANSSRLIAPFGCI